MPIWRYFSELEENFCMKEDFRCWLSTTFLLQFGSYSLTCAIGSNWNKLNLTYVETWSPWPCIYVLSDFLEIQPWTSLMGEHFYPSIYRSWIGLTGISWYWRACSSTLIILPMRAFSQTGFWIRRRMAAGESDGKSAKDLTEKVPARKSSCLMKSTRVYFIF